MIKINVIEKNFMVCHSCHSDSELVEISIGVSERQMLKVRLCEKCLTELNKKINS